MSATQLASVQLGKALTNDPAGVNCDAVNGNVFVNTGKTVLRFANQSTSATATITFTPAVTYEGETITPLVVTVPTSVTSPAAWQGEIETDVWGRECIFTASASTVKVTVFEP